MPHPLGEMGFQNPLILGLYVRPETPHPEVSAAYFGVSGIVNALAGCVNAAHELPIETTSWTHNAPISLKFTALLAPDGTRYSVINAACASLAKGWRNSFIDQRNMAPGLTPSQFSSRVGTLLIPPFSDPLLPPATAA